MFDDKKLGAIFPTRDGGSIGTALENKMLGIVGGAGGIRTRIQTLPDGSTVTLKTRAGMPEFTRQKSAETTDAGSCVIQMDSGIADMLSINQYSAGYSQPGIVYHTDYVDSQMASLIGVGKLKYPHFTGTAVSNGATAASIPDSSKKRIAVNIPPSMFTGRMRLYIQSLYGGVWDDLILEDVSDGGRPVISVNTVTRQNSNLTPTYIGSGCGLYFDKPTCRHYMIVLETTYGIFIPLVASPCAENYRDLLLDASLSESDAQKIEAYILSMSVPVPEIASTFEFEETPNEAMGYSWHFNWDGDTCDIIDVQEVSLDDDGKSIYGFTSTHYNLAFSVSNAVVSANRSIVSSSSWSLPKNINVIAYPLWSNRELIKAGNLPSQVMAKPKTGKIYCYYDKNDLKILTVSTSTIDRRVNRTSSPEYFGGTSYSNPVCWLLEGENGASYGESVSNGKRIEFSIGAENVTGESKTSTHRDVIGTWHGRELVSYAMGGYDTGTGTITVPSGYTYAVDQGMPTINYSLSAWGEVQGVTYPYTNQFSITTTDNGVIYATVHYFCAVWKTEYKTYSKVASFKSLVVIPFMDAEAVYVSGSTTSHDYGEIVTSMKSSHFAGGFDVSFHGDEVTTYPYFERYNASAIPPNNAYLPFGGTQRTTFDTTETTDDNRLISIAGTFSVGTMPGSAAAYSVEDSIPQNYATLSSVNGAIKASAVSVWSGSGVFPEYMTYLGWA